MDSNDVAHDRHKWQALVQNGNEISGSEYTGNYWVTGELLAYQEGLCSKASVSYLVSQSVSQSVNQRQSIH